MASLEQVEKLRTMANVSYEEAKTALEATNGDLLEAIIYLEKQGKVSAPAGDGYYSSEKAEEVYAMPCDGKGWKKRHRHDHCRENFHSHMHKFSEFCFRMLRKGNAISFEVLKGEESKASIPVIALALLLIFAFWVIVPLIIVGLFFGFRYRFNGTDFSGNIVNNAMNSAADAAENFKKSMDK
jgi:hypothetical protein